MFVASFLLSVSHHREGDARQRRQPHVDLRGFDELLGLVHVETQSSGAHDAEHDEESAAQPGEVLRGTDVSLSEVSGSSGSVLEGFCPAHVGVSPHTQDLLQQRGEAGEDGDAGAEAQQQHQVRFVPQQLQTREVRVQLQVTKSSM